MEPEEIRSLHRMCVVALRDYIDAARKTCTILEAMGQFPLSREVWRRAVEQRLAENDAHDRYRVIREQLFEAPRPSITATDGE
jgi:hypothetical protein